MGADGMCAQKRSTKMHTQKLTNNPSLGVYKARPVNNERRDGIYDYYAAMHIALRPNRFDSEWSTPKILQQCLQFTKLLIAEQEYLYANTYIF